MTQNNNSDDRGSTMVTRRNVLIGLGVAGAGTLAGLDQFTDVLEGGGSNLGGEHPPLTNPNNGSGTDESAFQTPWDADELIVSVQWDEQDSTSSGWFENAFRDTGAYDEIQNAVGFWNDYIDVNAAFDLTLTFDPNADTPDIMLRQLTAAVRCSGQYKSPATSNEGLKPEVCVETLADTPSEDDLPVSGKIGVGQGGQAVYRLIVQHTIGRLLGYDIWSDPVHVMTPKNTFSAATPDNSRSRRLLSHPSDEVRTQQRFAETASRKINAVQNPEPNTAADLENFHDDLQDSIDSFTASMNEWLDLVEAQNAPLYAEVYEETILNEDIAYLQGTADLITEILNTHTDEEIANGPEALNTLSDRLETIANWPDTTDPYDLRIHQYFTNEVWSAWAAEQTPTATNSA